ncbi:MAG: hypothetical protein RLZZ271_220 [Pseudomonadota bacterium]|jgi:hydroxymethylpyrimidine/phosphomethylpyrimidine kinase
MNQGKTADDNTPDNGQSSSDDSSVPCVLVFNASDPSGSGGLSADLVSICSVGGHALPVVTGAYARDTARVFEFYCFDDEAVEEQARATLEDISPMAIKVGFAGSPENLGMIAQLCSDYDSLPVVTYMPDLSWWQEMQIEQYLDACTELLLPQTSVLCGNYSTLLRWLLPDWSNDKAPSARDIARAAAQHGVPYTLVTGMPHNDQHIHNVLASPEAVLIEKSFEKFEAIFTGAGETLAATLAALVAHGTDLVAATDEALLYLDQSLNAGFRPGMGHVIPDRMFWATPDESENDEGTSDTPASRLQ